MNKPLSQAPSSPTSITTRLHQLTRKNEFQTTANATPLGNGQPVLRSSPRTTQATTSPLHRHQYNPATPSNQAQRSSRTHQIRLTLPLGSTNGRPRPPNALHSNTHRRQLTLVPRIHRRLFNGDCQIHTLHSHHSLRTGINIGSVPRNPKTHDTKST